MYLKVNACAYLHWYERYGVERDLFYDSLERLREIDDAYRLSK